LPESCNGGALVAILGYSKDQITAAVQAMYGEVSSNPDQPFHFPVGRSAALAVGYPSAELDRAPREAVASFAGAGYPFRAGVIKTGDTVLDLGAGSGTDSFIASQLVGDDGKVWALDITPAMLDTLTSGSIRLQRSKMHRKAAAVAHKKHRRRQGRDPASNHVVPPCRRPLLHGKSSVARSPDDCIWKNAIRKSASDQVLGGALVVIVILWVALFDLVS
jgi:SAM-dependent methyltransferase